MTALLLTGALLMTGCTPGSGDGDEDAQDDRLQEARARVLDDVTPVLRELVADLPATLRFSSGKYNSCQNDLSGATAVTFAVNGRLDLAGAGPAGLEAVRTAFDGAGFEVADDDSDLTVSATKGGTLASISTLGKEPALLFNARDDGCYGVGGDKARGYSVEKDPITLD